MQIFAWGGIYYRGEPDAEADGIFIHVPPHRMLEIVSGNAQGSEAPFDADWRRVLMTRRAHGARRSWAGHALVLSVRRARQSRGSFLCRASPPRPPFVPCVEGAVVGPLAHLDPNGSIGSEKSRK